MENQLLHKDDSLGNMHRCDALHSSCLPYFCLTVFTYLSVCICRICICMHVLKQCIVKRCSFLAISPRRGIGTRCTRSRQECPSGTHPQSPQFKVPKALGPSRNVPPAKVYNVSKWVCLVLLGCMKAGKKEAEPSMKDRPK